MVCADEREHFLFSRLQLFPVDNIVDSKESSFQILCYKIFTVLQKVYSLMSRERVIAVSYTHLHKFYTA